MSAAALQPFLFGEGWQVMKDGDDTVRRIFDRHYSRIKSKNRKMLFVGPGEKLVLIWPDATAIFVWRLERFSKRGDVGVNCAVFRNEGRLLSSDIIRQADAIADRQWPAQRHYTYVDAVATQERRGKAKPPGYCFIMAGWHPCGMTKGGHGKRAKHVLERLPA